MKAKKTVFRICFTCAVLLFSALFRAGAETASPAGPSENLLMMTLNDIADRFGFPVSVFTVRGPQESQDDVVFRYGNGADLYIVHNYVWQVGLHTPEAGSAAGVSVGMAKEDAERLLPQAVSTSEDSSLYRISRTDFPVGIQIYWNSSGRISDIFVFRADY